MKFAFAFAMMLIMSEPGFTEAHHVDEWPKDIAKIPCSAWKRNDDGSWTQIEPVFVGNIQFTGNTFKDGMEAKMLDTKCKSI